MIDDDDYGAVGGMRIGRGNRSTRRKPTFEINEKHNKTSLIRNSRGEISPV
jgi:hypothetical protein